MEVPGFVVPLVVFVLVGAVIAVQTIYDKKHGRTLFCISSSFLKGAFIVALILSLFLYYSFPTYYHVEGTKSEDDVRERLAINGNLFKEFGGRYTFNQTQDTLVFIGVAYGREFVDSKDFKVIPPNTKKKLNHSVDGWFCDFPEEVTVQKGSGASRWHVLTIPQLLKNLGDTDEEPFDPSIYE